jgi:hypothetical protein
MFVHDRAGNIALAPLLYSSASLYLHIFVGHTLLCKQQTEQKLIVFSRNLVGEKSV